MKLLKYYAAISVLALFLICFSYLIVSAGLATYLWHNREVYAANDAEKIKTHSNGYFRAIAQRVIFFHDPWENTKYDSLIALHIPRDYFEIDMVYDDNIPDKLVVNGYFSHIFMLVLYMVAFIFTVAGFIKFVQLKKST